MKFANFENTFDVNVAVDAAEKAAVAGIAYLPESVKDHAGNIVSAQFEYVRAGVATANRMSKIVKTATEDAVEAVRKSMRLG